jgi:thioredoxin 1
MNAHSADPVPEPLPPQYLSGREYLVACLCAAWCHTCDEYRPGFDALAERFPQAAFRWFDIEDDAEIVGEHGVENFPTILVQRGGQVLFYGAQLPVHEHLRRLLEQLLR